MSRILLVEDHPANQKLYQIWLKATGHEVESVESAAAAIQEISEHEFDLIITDIALPGMSGLQFSKLIRANDRTKHISILCISAYSTSSSAQAGCCDAYLQKPFSRQVFLLQVDVLIGF